MARGRHGRLACFKQVVLRLGKAPPLLLLGNRQTNTDIQRWSLLSASKQLEVAVVEEREGDEEKRSNEPTLHSPPPALSTFTELKGNNNNSSSSSSSSPFTPSQSLSLLEDGDSSSSSSRSRQSMPSLSPPAWSHCRLHFSFCRRRVLYHIIPKHTSLSSSPPPCLLALPTLCHHRTATTLDSPRLTHKH